MKKDIRKCVSMCRNKYIHFLLLMSVNMSKFRRTSEQSYWHTGVISGKPQQEVRADQNQRNQDWASISRIHHVVQVWYVIFTLAEKNAAPALCCYSPVTILSTIQPHTHTGRAELQQARSPSWFPSGRFLFKVPGVGPSHRRMDVA